MSFKKASWINLTDVYEVNLRQYTDAGTFNAFAAELPRLKEMGVSALWFMPVTPIALKMRKGALGSYYACSDYVSVNPEFGTMEDFKNLVQKAHEMGFKVIIDWVANHTGWDHVWTKTHPEYYKWDNGTNNFQVAKGMEDIIELDYKNHFLRKAMIESMEFWVTECDIDGFRCDLAFWVGLDFWLEARADLEKVKTLFWLAENDGIDNPQYYQAFDACYTWSWMHKTEEFYQKDQDVALLDAVLIEYDYVGSADALKLWFTANHDENSWNGTEYEKYGDAALALAVFSFTWHGIPLIYSGQELPNMKRLMFFDKDTIEWKGNYGLHDFYEKLLHLRKSNPALISGNKETAAVRLITNDPHKVLAYKRKSGEREVLVILNLSKQDLVVEIRNEEVTGTFTNIFTHKVEDLSAKKIFALQAWGYIVLEK